MRPINLIDPPADHLGVLGIAMSDDFQRFRCPAAQRMDFGHVALPDIGEQLPIET